MTSSKNYKYSYKKSGVDVTLGNKLVEHISPMANETSSKGTLSKIGGFGGIYDFKLKNYKDPLLVSTTDGVGTKLLLAKDLNNYSTIGIDLVAMSVNDLIVQGAEPIFFLDYIAVEKLDLEKVKNILTGIKNGCIESNCSLIGGETAELPGLYNNDTFDLAGFAVGMVERSKILPKKDILCDDIIIGLKSNGFHSNGYSLIRTIIKDEKISINDSLPFNKNLSIGEALLRPTKIYVKPIISALKKCNIKALAHITGGGITHNLPRVIPNNLGASINKVKLPINKKDNLFGWLQNISGLDDEEMLKTFNCGIGMVIIANKKEFNNISKYFSNDEISIIGKITETVGVSYYS